MLAVALRPYPVSPSDTSKDFVVAIFYFKMRGLTSFKRNEMP